MKLFLFSILTLVLITGCSTKEKPKKSGDDYFKEGMQYIDNLDFENATKSFKKSCDLNDGQGCYNLSVSYNLGKGVKKNLEKVAMYSKKSCDLNISSGCYTLGQNYKKGEGYLKILKKQ